MANQKIILYITWIIGWAIRNKPFYINNFIKTFVKELELSLHTYFQ